MIGLTRKFNAIITKLRNNRGAKRLELEFEVDGNKRKYDFEGESIDITIGRSEDSDVVIEHASVSRKHARVWIEDNAVWIEDLGSKNGTYVNDKKIEKRHRVRDEITVGWVRVKIDMWMDYEKNNSLTGDEKYVRFSLISGIILAITGMGIIIFALFYSFL